MKVAARTEAGLVRDQNQDRYLVWKLGVDGGERAGQFTFCAVADGVGGHSAGDRASALALETLADFVLPVLALRCGGDALTPHNLPRLLAEGIRRANCTVNREANENEALAGMSTTLTAGLLSRGVFYLAQVGDSRCYRLRNGLLEQQTTDHSLVGELVRMGKLSPEQARKHPRRNVITRAVGVQEDLEVELTCQAVEPGDVFLFCSDGLWELVADPQIRAIVAEAIPAVKGTPGQDALDETCGRLVRAALQEGGTDNITVLIAAVEASDVHPDASDDIQSFARTRVETAGVEAQSLRKTLRYRLQEWQQ